MKIRQDNLSSIAASISLHVLLVFLIVAVSASFAVYIISGNLSANGGESGNSCSNVYPGRLPTLIFPSKPKNSSDWKRLILLLNPGASGKICLEYKDTGGVLNFTWMEDPQVYVDDPTQNYGQNASEVRVSAEPNSFSTTGNHTVMIAVNSTTNSTGLYLISATDGECNEMMSFPLAVGYNASQLSKASFQYLGGSFGKLGCARTSGLNESVVGLSGFDVTYV